MRLPAAVLAASLLPAAAYAEAACRYDVDVDPALALDVRVSCDAGVRSLDPTQRPLTDHATDVHGERTDQGFHGGYHLELAALARDEASIDSALAVGRSVLAVGDAWLLRPLRDAGGPGVLRVHVRTAPGVGFATGQPVTDGVFRIPGSELDYAGFSAFGALRTRALTAVDGDGRESAYRAVLMDGAVDVGDHALVDWIHGMGSIMARFWHGFPAPGMAIFVVPRADRAGVPFGRTMGGGGASMVLFVGEHATPAELHDDWVLIHELVHLGSPFIRHAPWLSEGLATYLEPLIRARAGLQTPAAMWTEFMTHMNRGAAIMGETGLARGGPRGWYYGGALLMLMADVQMRRASGGRTGLEECLRAVRREIGNFRHVVDVDEMVSACDGAVGGHVLRTLVDRHAMSAGAVDLDALWRDLGLHLEAGTLTMRDDAPLSAVREAIMRGSP